MPIIEKRSKCDTFKGIIGLVLAITIYTFVNLVQKISVENYGATANESMYYGAMISSIIFMVCIRFRGKDVFDVPHHLISTMFMRVLSGSVANLLLLLAVTLTSYSKAMCIFMTNTLMIPFFAGCFLGEKLICCHIVCIFVGFLGVLCTAIPYKDVESLFKAFKDESKVNLDKKSVWLDIMGIVTSFASAFVTSMTVIWVKRLNNAKIPFDVIGFYL